MSDRVNHDRQIWLQQDTDWQMARLGTSPSTGQSDRDNEQTRATIKNVDGDLTRTATLRGGLQGVLRTLAATASGALRSVRARI